MRKMLLWIIGIIAVVVVLSRSSDLADLLVTLQTGAWLPLAVAALFEVAKYFSQAFAVSAAFEATGAKRSPLHLVPVVFSAMFVNSIAPSGGTAGTLLYIEDARRDGVSIARSTPAILIYDVAYFLGFMLIMVIGFAVLALSHSMQPYYLFAGFLLVLVVMGFSALLILGYFKPRWLNIGALWVEKKLASFMQNKLHRAPLKPWGAKISKSFEDTAHSIANAPAPALRAVGFMTLTAGLDMLAMTAVGFAFGYTVVPMLVATYVVAQLLTVFSPTPQGVGIVETAIALLLTSFGLDVAAATAVAIVYRGYVYWIPFLLGAISLKFTKLFVSTKTPTEDQRVRDRARINALIVFVLGVVSIALAVLPAPPGAWANISEWLANGQPLSPTYVVIGSILLILLTHELWMRRRTGWALTIVVLLLNTVMLLSSGRGMRIAIVLIAMTAWLFSQFRIYTVTGEVKNERLRFVAPAAFALIVALGYGVVGFLMLSDEFVGITNLGTAVVATLQALLPFVPGPEALNEHGAWFAGSMLIVGRLALLYAAVAILYLVLSTRRQVRKYGSLQEAAQRKSTTPPAPAAAEPEQKPTLGPDTSAEEAKPLLTLVVANDAPAEAPDTQLDEASGEVRP